MRVFQDFDLIGKIAHPVLTIGTFDGVHLGHQKIIDQLNQEAQKIGGESVLFTFFPHPRMVLYPESHGLKLIQSQEEKLIKLKETGLQNLIVYPFSFEFSRLTALEFVRDYLVNQLQVKKMVIGYDHQFGKNREGSIGFLKDISETYGFKVIEIAAQEIDEVNISSTKIREALFKGDIVLANKYLGQSFRLTGRVVKGDQLGRKIGYPTANIELEDPLKLVPANGVYAVNVLINDHVFKGMMNIGHRPTVAGLGAQRIEVHIFDFDSTLYGERIVVEMLDKIRDEKKFDSIESLKAQLMKDEDYIRSNYAAHIL